RAALASRAARHRRAAPLPCSPRAQSLARPPYFSPPRPSLCLPSRRMLCAPKREGHGGNAMSRYVGAIDQGTTSSRFILFDETGAIVALAQKEHAQIYPQPGWVEHDAVEVWRNTEEVVGEALARAGVIAADVAAVGITNQRETTVLWERATGRPIANAIVWQDTRTAAYLEQYERDGGPDRFRARTGLPLATYFSALKLRWLLDNVPG